MGIRISLAALLCSAAVPALAAPPIAMIIAGGNNQSVWLMQPDGTGSVQVYVGPPKTSLADVDVRPGGGQLALVQGGSTIELINYNASGALVSVASLPLPGGCGPQGLDYSPVDGSLLVSDSCNGISNILRWDGSSLQTVLTDTSGHIQKLRWLRDGSGFLWWDGAPAGLRLRKSDLNNPSAFTTLWSISSTSLLNSFDIAHTSDAFLLRIGTTAAVHRYAFDFSGVVDQGIVAAGLDARYSPADDALLYRQQTRSGYKLILKTASGTQTISSGNIGQFDWGL